MAKQRSGDAGLVSACLSILNSVLHIIESILSQEELPDFYEENLPHIAAVLSFFLGDDSQQF